MAQRETSGEQSTADRPYAVIFTHDELAILQDVIEEIRDNGVNAWPKVGDFMGSPLFVSCVEKLRHPTTGPPR